MGVAVSVTTTSALVAYAIGGFGGSAVVETFGLMVTWKLTPGFNLISYVVPSETS
jgi:hypothetical protein